MTHAPEPLRDVVVVGGGLIGWSAAAALKRRVPGLSVSIMPLAPPPEALADRVASTLPSIMDFHSDLGLRIEDTVLRTGSTYRLGSLFRCWTKGGADYVHAYCGDSHPIGGIAFHLLWARAAMEGAPPPFEALSPAAMVARAGRFVPPTGDSNTPLGEFGVGLTLDVARYLAMIRAFARHVGVVELAGDLREVILRGEDGFIEALCLDDGSLVRGTLFLDCTGSDPRLHSVLDPAWEDWSRWLPCDRILFAEGPPTSLSPLDTTTANATGWRWSSTTARAGLHGIAYASGYASDEAAESELRTATGAQPDARPIVISAGARPRAWLRNCVAIGDAAVTLEPLEWTNLHLAHSAIDRLIEMLPGREWVGAEAADYNRQTLAEVRRARDFAALRYAVADRDEPFWRERAGIELPPSLAHTLSLFRERGRLPFYEEETFGRESWLAVLFGQGVLPRRIDPLTDALPREEARRLMEIRRAAIAAAIPPLPTLGAFLGAQLKQLER